MKAYAKSLLAACFWVCCHADAVADEPAFNRDVRPLLADKCFACHGPDEKHREADLRLDQREGAVELEAIVPGNPDESELIRRIESDDPDVRMPPADSQATLTAAEKDLLRRWIVEGAKYEAHWSFVPPSRPAVPAVERTDWPRNPIDHFVLARLEDKALPPSPEADRYTLARRLYLDLIGLPPTPSEADAFVHNESEDAYEQLVDTLLKSEHYGERWARQWLDLARYADTNGYEKDRPRSIWPYRDWVIQALNTDMPFDQFTIEQLAGDMLPEATLSQKIATGFHRNTMLNEEGGIDPLEYRFYAMVDRVATTGTVWLGLTTGCAQCHSHKYDPISHTDYYSLMALLNNADEPDLLVETPEVAAARREVEQQIEALELQLIEKIDNEQFSQWRQQRRDKLATWHVWRPRAMTSNLPKLELLDDSSIFSSGDITKRDVFTLTFQLADNAEPIRAIRLEALPDERLPDRGPGRAYYEGRKGDFFLSEITATHNGHSVKFANASHSYGKISIGSGSAAAANVIDSDGSTGWSTAGREGEAHQIVINSAKPVAAGGRWDLELLFERHFAASLGRFRLSWTSDPDAKATAIPADIEALLVRDVASWSADERSRVMRYYLLTDAAFAEACKPLDALRKRLPRPPDTMVMLERPDDNPRETFRHHRGEYLSPRESVSPGIPKFLQSADERGPANRLEFAQWLASPRNPLVARVAVNRAWQALFGSGLVRTSDDFGTQADAPTHPELLDWLACEFVEQGWSLKELHRLIVTSATYRQASRVTPQLRELDPHNELLARGARFRVDAEIVRDIVLKASGLLSDKMYGPGVYPPQPASVTALAYGNTRWNVSKGEDRYRRSLYTFSKRTAPFAAFTVFDAPTGETCVARRDRSNTPLQALTLLNDEMFLEMARAVAIQVLPPAAQQAVSRETIATDMFRRFVVRPPEPRELQAILEFQESQRQRLERGELDASLILAAKNSKAADKAAWVMVARAIMNLDEVITRP